MQFHRVQYIPKFERSSAEAIPLNDQQQLKLQTGQKIIKDYFIAGIKEKELMSKRFSKYVDSSDYFDKSLIVLSVTTGSISIASFATVIGAPVEL